ncbi:MAG: Eco57I restriction-modification methylase domain-containing protein [Promethearchaeota archaeon]
MVENKKLLDFKDITKLFGLRSEIFKEAIEFLKKKTISEKKRHDKKFSKWQSAFKYIYGSDADQNLFLLHTYFALILKNLVSIKLSVFKNFDLEDAYQDSHINNLGALQVFELEYFNWTHLSKRIFKKIYAIIEDINFARQDLFHELYQQLIFSVTRHKIGEFYTPFNLVKKMVNDSYKFGMKVLDPTVGSGSFLINIIINILNSNKPNSLKPKAINNIFGIDINPLAVITAKINIFILFLDYYDIGKDEIPKINIFHFDSLFPEKFETKLINQLYNSFDLIIGNPPWLTYKELTSKEYQNKIRKLAKKLEIKPSSQYITHIELAAIFFYAIPSKFLKIGGKIFFVLTKSILNGDHCYKFRAFSIFQNLEIWDFPNFYFFKIDHICLKAEYIGKDNNTAIKDKYPIKTKLFNDDLELQQELFYSTIKLEKEGTRLILPEHELRVINKMSTSPYKKKFSQGATLVPRNLVFFEVVKKKDDYLVISSNSDIMSRAKKNWRYYFQNKEIEEIFRYKTFLNKDLIPFIVKKFRFVFLPINDKFEFDIHYLKQKPKAFRFYNEMNEIYQKRKKNTSKINTLFANLNYWNKLIKQFGNKEYLIVYNASGSNLKAAVIQNLKRKIVVGSENYYFATESKEEAYYLAGILNSPGFAKNVRLIKSSRHIHKRPFLFSIPLYDENNEIHGKIAKKAVKCETIVQDLFFNNPNINTGKVKIIINQKLQIINKLVEQIIFN